MVLRAGVGNEVGGTVLNEDTGSVLQTASCLGGDGVPAAHKSVRAQGVNLETVGR